MKQILEILMALFGKKKEQPKIKEPHSDQTPEEDVVDQTLLDARKEDQEIHTPIHFKDESARLKQEWEQLDVKNEGLYDLILDLNEYTNKKFKKGLVITMIYRTQAEQDHLYRNSEKYKKKPFTSPHQFWQAVDLRSRTFTAEEIRLMVNWINRKYNKSNYWKWTAKAHDIGSGMHFHIQWVKPN